MAVGSFLSEESVEEFQDNKIGKKVSEKNPILGGIIMFVSFVVAGFIPLFPYLVATGNLALIISIIISLLSLGILGYVSAVVTKAKPFRRAMRMLILGGSAVIIGALVSIFVKAS